MRRVGTTCSVGLGYSMMAAKLASEEKKPDGYFEIRTPADFRTLVYDRADRRDLWGRQKKYPRRVCIPLG